METFPIIVVGNKVDRPDEMKSVSNEDAQKWCDENNILRYYEVSAKENINVTEAFTELANAALDQEDIEDKYIQ